MRLHDEWLLTPHRMAVHEPTSTAVIADLHLGYLEARRQGGDSVPLIDLATLLAPLEQGLAATGARNLVIAGDLFEKVFLPRTWNEMSAWLVARGVHLLGVVPGNHDRQWDEDAAPSLFPNGFPLADWLIAHGHQEHAAEKVILGHWHPAMHYRDQLSPCYLVKGGQLILPAFSREAAGVNVWPMPQWRGYRCMVIHGANVLDVGVIRQALPRSSAPAAANRKSRPWQGRLRPG